MEDGSNHVCLLIAYTYMIPPSSLVIPSSLHHREAVLVLSWLLSQAVLP